MLRHIIIILYIFVVASCSQEPTKIIYKGHNFYGKNIKDNSIYERPAPKSAVAAKVIPTKNEEIENYIKVKSGDSLFIIAKQN